MTGLLYLERLSLTDLTALAEAEGGAEPLSDRVARLKEDPERIGLLIDRPEVHQALFQQGNREEMVFTSPFLAFAVLLAQVTRELEQTAFVPERLAPRRVVPVFDAANLRAFAESRMRRMFLADVLASYTHVASGVVWTRGSRGWSRRKFSELDPIHMARLIVESPQPARLALYRRLGDLSLFLSGVFPDHVGNRLFGPSEMESLRRALSPGGRSGHAEDERGRSEPVEFLEGLGRRSYRMASAGTLPGAAGMADVLAEMAEDFSLARRVLNVLTERHLFPIRDRWFPAG